MIKYRIINRKNGYLVTHVEPLTSGSFRAHTDGNSVKIFSTHEDAVKYFKWNCMGNPYKVVKLKIEIEEGD